jgi:hypothetical protein
MEIAWMFIIKLTICLHMSQFGISEKHTMMGIVVQWFIEEYS